MRRSFKELMRLKTFEERYSYLKLDSGVGAATFGYDRHINQTFYHSSEWKNLRNFIIVRDNGCDLATPGFEIHDRILIHHINPITVEDLTDWNDDVMDPENLITTTHFTHNAIHFGTEALAPRVLPDRKPGDTALW